MRERALVAWANHKLQPRCMRIADISRDTASCLPALVELLTGRSLGHLKGTPTLRMHRLANVNRALAVVRVCGDEVGAPLVYGADAIVDGKRSAVQQVLLILVQTFSIEQVNMIIPPLLVGDCATPVSERTLEQVKESDMVADRGLLEWARKSVDGYEGVDLVDFHESWRSGLAMCALVSR